MISRPLRSGTQRLRGEPSPGFFSGVSTPEKKMMLSANPVSSVRDEFELKLCRSMSSSGALHRMVYRAKRARNLGFPLGKTKTGQDDCVELLEVFEVPGENSFKDVYIDGLVVVNGDIPETNHRLHFLR